MTAYGFLLKTNITDLYTLVFLKLKYKHLDGYLFLGKKGSVRDLLNDTLIDYPALYIIPAENELDEDVFLEDIDEIYGENLKIKDIITKEEKQTLINDLKPLLKDTEIYPYDHFYKIPMDKIAEEKENILNLSSLYNEEINPDHYSDLAKIYMDTFEEWFRDLLPYMINYIVFIDELLT